MIRIADDPYPTQAQLDQLWLAAWGFVPEGYAHKVLPRSLAHVGALEGERLAGFVNVAWDGGVHAFLLDTGVDPEFRRQGLATKLVARAAVLSRERGAHWLHVDYEPALDGFYRGCGFSPTAAGLIGLAAV
ncbi:MAG: N-acetyltransferase [Hyphomicrobiales bacterium]|nr:MAG: N-acetyltransferase [Hyphomicrobiales bacterium]